jgi:hypothetical protein
MGIELRDNPRLSPVEPMRSPQWDVRRRPQTVTGDARGRFLDIVNSDPRKAIREQKDKAKKQGKLDRKQRRNEEKKNGTPPQQGKPGEKK